MISDCCVRYHASGYSVCPVCRGQEQVDREERQRAYGYQAELKGAPPKVAKLIESGYMSASAVGGRERLSARALELNPHRRQFFRLTGVYLPEREAKQALLRIEEYKWLEAEKVGFDIWTVVSPDCSFRAAARHWAVRHLAAFLAACCPGTEGRLRSAPG